MVSFGLYLSCYPLKNAGRQNESVSSPILGISLNSSKYIMALEEGKKIAGSKKKIWQLRGRRQPNRERQRFSS